MRRLPPVYPVAIAVAYVLAVFADGAFPPADLIRPLLVAIALTLIVQVVATSCSTTAMPARWSPAW